MSKKVTPQGLYLKELKKQSHGRNYDIQAAAAKFKLLSVSEKDFYEVSAKRINEKNPTEVVFTTQRDTLGNNLKEVSEREKRKSEWERNSLNTILSMSSSDDILHKEFYTIKISGAEFCRSETNKSCYVTSEICIIKFSFMNGIIDQLILFPEVIKVAAGYRQNLYEDLEENVGWKPETFRNNHSINDTIIAIRNFFNGKYEPIYVPTKDHRDEVGMGLYTLYGENQMACPWLECYEDWGKKCTIYQLEQLVLSVLNRSLDDNYSSVAIVLDFWARMKVEMAPETCERHLQYGLANQCATNILLKYLYGSFLLLQSPEMPNIRSLVSEDFYKDMDHIAPEEPIEDHDTVNKNKPTNSVWDNYFFEKTGIEDVITSMSGITIKSDVISNFKKQSEWGRGRGLIRKQDIKTVPGFTSTQRKKKLPKVVC